LRSRKKLEEKAQKNKKFQFNCISGEKKLVSKRLRVASQTAVI
jgi:hypothetical protein